MPSDVPMVPHPEESGGASERVGAAGAVAPLTARRQAMCDAAYTVSVRRDRTAGPLRRGCGLPDSRRLL